MSKHSPMTTRGPWSRSAPRRRVLTVALSLVAAGPGACGHRSGAAAAPEPFPGAPRLVELDRAFARASAERGAAAWAAVWGPEGRLAGTGAPDAVGPAEVRAAVTPLLERYGARFRWEPTASGMLWPDSLGYTLGDWWIEPDSGAGEPAAGPVDTLRYLTVWQRLDGAWKVALDLSLPAAQAGADAGDFQFWLGDWTVDQRLWTGLDGEFEAYGGRARVRAVPGGGAVVESSRGEARFAWAGMEEPVPVRWASVRVSGGPGGAWKVYRIDSVTSRFAGPFEGGFADGVGTFVDSAGAGEPEGATRRILIRPEPDGSVRWELARRGTDGEGWRPLWLINFTRDRTTAPRR